MSDDEPFEYPRPAIGSPNAMPSEDELMKDSPFCPLSQIGSGGTALSPIHDENEPDPE